MQSSSSYNSGSKRGISYYRAIREAQSVQRVEGIRKIKVPKLKMSQSQLNLKFRDVAQTPNVLEMDRKPLVELRNVKRVTKCED